MNETSIKAKSMKCYSTYNRKLTENKWKLGEAKPELVEDWDQRMLVSTLTKENDNTLVLLQEADKEQVKNTGCPKKMPPSCWNR